jgi:hypothetical protein
MSIDSEKERRDMTSVKLDYTTAARKAREIGDEAHSMSDFVTLHRQNFEEALIKAYIEGFKDGLKDEVKSSEKKVSG